MLANTRVPSLLGVLLSFEGLMLLEPSMKQGHAPLVPADFKILMQACTILSLQYLSELSCAMAK